MDTFLQAPLLEQRISKSSLGDEDAAQAAWLCLVEAARAEASFGEQQIGYQIKRATWETRHHREKGHTYNRYVFQEPMVRDGNDWVGLFDEVFPSADPTPEEALLRKERLRQLAAAIDSLPAKQRQVVTHLSDGLSQSEIVECTGLSKSSVSHVLARARVRLLAELEQ